jgi:hypothetical protein
MNRTPTVPARAKAPQEVGTDPFWETVVMECHPSRPRMSKLPSGLCKRHASIQLANTLYQGFGGDALQLIDARKLRKIERIPMLDEGCPADAGKEVEGRFFRILL